MSHKTVQKLNAEIACWFHAYLHRVEGDQDNADYWYSRAHMEPTTASLETELSDIIKFLCSNNFSSFFKWHPA